MSGWERMEGDLWEETMELLPRPLPRSHARHDLRHIVYGARARGRRVPSNREIAERWGWLTRSGRPADEKVRRLKASGDWEDPHKAKRGIREERTRNRRGIREEPETVQPAESPDPRGTGEESARNGRGKNDPTRVLEHPSPSTEHPHPCPPSLPTGRTPQSKRSATPDWADGLPSWSLTLHEADRAAGHWRINLLSQVAVFADGPLLALSPDALGEHIRQALDGRYAPGPGREPFGARIYAEAVRMLDRGLTPAQMATLGEALRSQADPGELAKRFGLTTTPEQPAQGHAARGGM